VSDLIDTTEMYLRTIYELDEEGIVPLRARIVERLGHSGPTVSQTVARMERDGLVVVSGDRRLELTDDGRAKAVRVMRKHRLAERLLTDVIGLEWEYLHDEACRWEHVMSDRVERRLLRLLDHPHRSPYGNPIPGLGELGDGMPDEGFLDGVVALTELLPESPASEPVAASASVAGPVEVTVRRIGEPIQNDIALLARLSKAGVLPEAKVAVRRDGDLTIGVPGSSDVVALSEDDARHLFVVV
jgi:DtxR family Mn-dependent transcriptional regulator